jgi:CheY-like chemotaxis protein
MSSQFKIIVTDDSSLARKMAIKALPEALRDAVFEARDGFDAVSAVKQKLAPLMLLDLTMPGMDGIDVLEAIQEEINDQSISVVVLSADIQPMMQERVLELGALAFLKKPVSASALEILIK